MKETKMRINLKTGVHARVAGLLVNKLSEYNCEFRLKIKDIVVDPKKLLALMNLGLKNGDEFLLDYFGTDENKVLAEIDDIQAILS